MAALGVACHDTGTSSATPAPSASASAPSAPSAAAPASTTRDRVAALVSAEERRASASVAESDLTASEPRVRRAAARALARIADDRAAELLAGSLSDEDAEVIVWSAYGLGYTCGGHAAEHVRALVTRAANLLLARAVTHETGAPSGLLLDPLSSIADALGRCGGEEAERSLRAWLGLGEPLRGAAAWALGRRAALLDRLDDETLVALLDAAHRKDAVVPGALQAFTRLSHLDDTVASRLYEVARAALRGSGVARALAIRALAATGERAAPDLAAVVPSKEFTAPERADAARALGRLGAAGQKALADSLAHLLEDPTVLSPAGLTSATYGVLSSVLAALEPPPDRAGPALARLAALPVGDGAALARRTVALRCGAASLLAGRGSASKVLAACDPDPKGRAGALARLAVLGRGPLAGARLGQWRALVAADDPVVRERALELVATHAEVEATSDLARALRSKLGGEVATAAHVIAEHPDRASQSHAAGAPAADVTRALGAALERWDASPSIEVRTNLADAAAALGLLAAKPRLEAQCQSDNPTLRAHAERALRRLGDHERRCTHFEPPKDPPAELARALEAPAHLTFETDAGDYELDLDPALAPVAVTRLVELAKSGFFDGIVIHRVVPGFVVQLGDPDGDGYGVAARPPLRCETSPEPFEAGSVGIALSGRDTGSSQFFVTLGREAHLDGDYALVGHAGPGWDRLAEGDVVKRVRVR